MADTLNIEKIIAEESEKLFPCKIGTNWVIGEAHPYDQNEGERETYADGMRRMYEILTEHHNKQLSDCWDEAVISGHAHSFSDDVQPLELDEKAVRKDKAAYLDKSTNTTSK